MSNRGNESSDGLLGHCLGVFHHRSNEGIDGSTIHGIIVGQLHHQISAIDFPVEDAVHIPTKGGSQVGVLGHGDAGISDLGNRALCRVFIGCLSLVNCCLICKASDGCQCSAGTVVIVQQDGLLIFRIGILLRQVRPLLHGTVRRLLYVRQVFWKYMN